MNIENFITQNYPQIFKDLVCYEILESLFNINDIQKP